MFQTTNQLSHLFSLLHGSAQTDTSSMVVLRPALSVAVFFLPTTLAGACLSKNMADSSAKNSPILEDATENEP